MAGDVLSLPFPPISVPLLTSSTPYRAPSRLHPSAWLLVERFSGTAAAGGAISVELWAPARRTPFLHFPHRAKPPAGPAARWQWFRLALRAMAYRPALPARDLWTCEFLREHWRQVGVVPFAHQLETARRVLFEMGGRAILADEVGLGKTVEAGMILHELLLRRLLRRCLILVPAGLVWQWYRELRDKFQLPVEIQASVRDWERVPLLVASLDTAKRSEHAPHLTRQPYDLVVVDEAHRLKNHRTLAFRLVASLKSRYLLLLTATPVHNSLRELHALLYLVNPGRVGDLAEFCRRFGARGRHAEDSAGLRELARSLMVRHRRHNTPLPFVRREVHTRAVELTQPERAFYAALDRLAPFAAPHRHQSTPCPSPGESASAAPVLPPLVWLTLKREACSSPHAACASLRRLAHRHRWPQLEELARQGESLSAWAKGQAVAELVRSLGDEHVLVFTEYSATQQALAHCLAQLGRPVVLFSGGLSPLQREWAQTVFQSRAPVMVCTDAAAEGLNLQFCRHLINADLPWNPMRIEQRIGRVHRLGQTRDVHVWNLYVKGTVDEYVLYLLHEKLNLFRSVVGELEAILESLGGGPAFEEALRRGLARLPARASEESGQMGLYLQQALEELVRQWNAALKRYTARLRRQQALLDEVSGAGSARSWP